MKTLLVIALLLLVSPVFAQVPPTAQATPTVQDLENQMQQVGWDAERRAAAQTIVNLQKQIADLQKQLAKDPPTTKTVPGKH